MSDETPASSPEGDEPDAQTPPAAPSPQGEALAAKAASSPEGDKPARKRAQAKATAASPEGEGAGDQPKAESKAAAGTTAEKKAAAKKAPSAKKPAARKKAGGASSPQGEKEKAAKPAAKPSRRGATAKPQRRRVVRARARYVRTSARKARMVCVHLRGKSVQEARAILAFTPREVARDWSKLLESAVANAESNHELLEDDLVVREAYADEGPTIKRFRPRAMGRATSIRKRTSHLTITLTARQ